MIERACSHPLRAALLTRMSKASVAPAARTPQRKPASRAVTASHKETLGAGYLKLGILLAMIFGPWAGIAYVARIAFAGH